MQTQYELLIYKLDEFIRKYYKNQLLRGSIYAVAATLAFFLTAALLEHFGRFDTGFRTALFYCFITGTGFILAKWVVIPLAQLYRLGKIISYEQAAAIIGSHFSNVQDKLLNVLLLNKQKDTGEAYSAALLEAGINQKIKELSPIPFTSAVNLSENKKHARYAIVPLAAFIAILFSAPDIITGSTQRIIAYNTYFEVPAPFKFIIENDDLRAIGQEDFELRVKIEGEEVPQDIYIELGETQFKLNKENTVSFNYIFKNVQKSRRFRLLANGFYSREYELEALPNPTLLDFTIYLDYPSYINKRDETVANTGDLIIPAGTKVTWSFNTRNTSKLHMSFADSAYALSPASNASSFSQQFLKNNTYAITTSNEYFKSRDSVLYAINVIPDLYPSIEAEQKADSLSPKRAYFTGFIKDDYGLSRLTFNYRHKKSEDSITSVIQNLNLNKGQGQQAFFHFFDFATLNLEPGDEVEYYFEVWDNDGVTGSKASRSQRMVFKAPTVKEIAQTTEKNNQNIKNSLQSTITEAREIQKELYDLNKKLVDKQNLNWEEKKRLEDLLNKQKELQKKVQDIQRQTQQNFSQQSEYKEQNEQLLEKQRQLEELFKEVLTDEMKKLMEELERLMGKLSKEKLQEKLDEMKLSNKDIEKELDRSLELFKQLEFEQKLQESIDKLNELSQEQQKLSEESQEKNADSKELKEKQEELNKEFEELKKELDNLEKKNEELEQPNALPKTEEQEKNIEQQMQNSSEQLEQQKNKKASESQKKAAEQMQQLSQQMQQAQQQNQQQQSEEDMNALREILENLLKLSFDQEGTMEELKKTDRNNPQYVKLSQNQKKIKDDAKMIEDSLFALSKRVPQIDAIVNREISAINMNMDKALEHLGERQTPQANSRQQFAMTSMNNLALLLSEALQQMQQQMQQQKQGQQSCSKPGSSGSPKPSAANMRKMQEQINKQIQKLKQQMEQQGGQPQGKSGKGNKQMSEELARLAAQQEAIRNQLQKLSEELGKDGNKGGGGNLDKMSKKMEETETDLVNKRITQETLKRQQEILTRLLEAEKAEKEREMDEKREATENKNENYSNPSQFLEYNRLKQKEAELLKTVPVTLQPFYKNKVNEYFQKIED